MNRREYLEELSNCLMSLSKEERDEALLYYEEFFEDAGVEHEQDVIKELGPPQKLAETIMNDSAINEERGLVLKQSYTEGSKTGNGHRSRTYGGTKATNSQGNTQKPQQKDYTALIIVIAILVVTAPVWISVVGAVLGVILFLIFSAAITVVTLGVMGVVFLIAGLIYLFVTPSVGLILIGVSLVSMGITTLVFTPILNFFIWLGKLTIKGSKSLYNMILGKVKRGEA